MTNVLILGANGQVARNTTRVTTALGDVTAVIHAAGVSPTQASPATILEVDLYGTALVLEEFGDVMRRRRGRDRLPVRPPPGRADGRAGQGARDDADGGTAGAPHAPARPGQRLSSAVEASASRTSEKLGVPIAGDDREAVQVAEQLTREAGCEPLVVGNLAAARSFQRGGPGFRANTTAPELRRLLGLGTR